MDQQHRGSPSLSLAPVVCGGQGFWHESPPDARIGCWLVSAP